MIVLTIIWSLGGIAALILIYREITIEGVWESLVTIDRDGILMASKKKSARLEWANVKMALYGNHNRTIIFSSNNNQYLFRKRVFYKEINDNCIFIELRPGVYEKIKQYYTGTIIREDKLKKRYI